MELAMNPCRVLLPMIPIVLLFVSALVPADDNSFPRVRNTEPGNPQPIAPEEALKRLKLPDGFEATLFAAEPDVQQPIAMAFDDRGRLWVAECYTYAEQKVNFAMDHRDRIIILEDTDNDGRFDRRKVFWDKCQKLTSIEIGFGGVWALCAPHLLFIPDKDGDDVPDGEPVVLLDGWDAGPVRHNIVNGLRWGPDGWLYGRHGIMATSRPGKPGTPRDQRRPINCGIWRYHPTRHVVEVVAHGTTNPWGMDFDDHGEMFFSNTVIGHLWHVIPGAHYKRMYGVDLNPHVYELIDQHADHYHWNTGKHWTDSREGRGEHGRLGGGHAHCGMMIYLGDNWPDRFRNGLFMLNIGGRRVNHDRLERHGSGYLGRHEPDLLFSDDLWFRGIELAYGPDGGVFILDWSDTGECHENDGVHRTSGRILKVIYGKLKPPAIRDVSRLSDAELVKLQLHKNDWYVRAARLELQERTAAGKDMKKVHAELLTMFQKQPDVTRSLRALWALWVTGGAPRRWLRERLTDPDEHIRAWAVRLLVDEDVPDSDTLRHFVRLAESDPSGLVRLYLASALQRLPVSLRGDLAEALLSHAEDAADHNLPLMIWYGVAALVPADPARAVQLAERGRIPLVRRFIARRLTEEVERKPEGVNILLQALARTASPQLQLDMLKGMSEALRGWRKAKPPAAWAETLARLDQSHSVDVRQYGKELGVIFGDGRAVESLLQLAADKQGEQDARRRALRVLVESRSEQLIPILKDLLKERDLAADAVRGLAELNPPGATELLLDRYGSFPTPAREETVRALIARKATALTLLAAVEKGVVEKQHLTAAQLRQLQYFENGEVNRLIAKLYPELPAVSEEKRKQIAKYKSALGPMQLAAANPPRGRMLFDKTCASCHTLFGEGGKIGPDLTGGQRDNLHYLLENIVDPSATLAFDQRMSILALNDDRIVNGVVLDKGERIVTVQTATDRLALKRSDIDTIKETNLSLMPEGLLDALSAEEVRDLIAYLMSPAQVDKK
jgi:putative membrane-bound dehydrogenase-like protein